MPKVIEIQTSEITPPRQSRLKSFRKLRTLSRNGSTEAVETQRKLRELANSLNTGCERLNKCAAGIVKLCESAAQVALDMGDHLRQAKELVDHGKFGRWLKRHCPGIGERHARKLMQASMFMESNRPHVADLESVRELFLFCGIIRAPEHKGKAPATFCLAIALRVVKPASRLSIEDVLKLPPTDQQQLREQLEPIHRIYQALPAPPPGKESIS
jgi:hypothetical protein